MVILAVYSVKPFLNDGLTELADFLKKKHFFRISSFSVAKEVFGQVKIR